MIGEKVLSAMTARQLRRRIAIQRCDGDRAKPDGIAVVLQEDAAFPVETKSVVLVELTAGNSGIPNWVARVGVDNLDSI